MSRGRCPSRCCQQGSDELGNIKGHPRERKEKEYQEDSQSSHPSLLVEKIKKKKPDNDPQEVCVGDSDLYV